MSTPEDTEPRTVPPTVLVHQEGVIAVIGLVGLAYRGEIVTGLAPHGAPLTAVFLGIAAGVAGFSVMWVLRGFRPMRELERWQRRMVKGWSATDAVVIALFSGLAEEAMIRALLQPIIGLVPAALVFAALHVVPDRRVWLWPVLALVLGLGLGWIFERGGYPAAATAHVAINLLSLLRLREAAAN